MGIHQRTGGSPQLPLPLRQSCECSRRQPAITFHGFRLLTIVANHDLKGTSRERPLKRLATCLLSVTVVVGPKIYIVESAVRERRSQLMSTVVSHLLRSWFKVPTLARVMHGEKLQSRGQTQTSAKARGQPARGRLYRSGTVLCAR